MDNWSPRRSALYVPGINARAIEKARTLACDALIFDWEDAVAPAMKSRAREIVGSALDTGTFLAREKVIRINGLGTPDFEVDLQAALVCEPDAILLPKVSTAHDLLRFAYKMRASTAGDTTPLWIMVETAAAISNLPAILQAVPATGLKLDCLVLGTNDLAKETGVSTGNGRRYFIPWLMSVILVAKLNKVTVLDGVWNDFGDTDGFDEEARQSREMGFDGKTLIHPLQVDPANAVFTPGEEAIADARRIIRAFERPESAAAGVIDLDGRMVERLHLEQAQHLVARVEATLPQVGRSTD
ncbi:citrate lyase subunit beta/citryl-CoA lyase [Paraburkholderia unamae]|uniref:HpcH/HpaI aldolase/citrate lyase family protein n=1 Tax=Paraburkholderia unamae TaxID=219649 RepID=UPI000DC584BD|nr:CoA ester lyase [Paraburkholderia unamae]RAR54574.1 citrate lyase subunit beta/citryl-CoA lyase [Paraburkholderia unamae]